MTKFLNPNGSGVKEAKQLSAEIQDFVRKRGLIWDLNMVALLYALRDLTSEFIVNNEKDIKDAAIDVTTKTFNEIIDDLKSIKNRE